MELGFTLSAFKCPAGLARFGFESSEPKPNAVEWQSMAGITQILRGLTGSTESHKVYLRRLGQASGMGGTSPGSWGNSPPPLPDCEAPSTARASSDCTRLGPNRRRAIPRPCAISITGWFGSSRASIVLGRVVGSVDLAGRKENAFIVLTEVTGYPLDIMLRRLGPHLDAFTRRSVELLDREGVRSAFANQQGVLESVLVAEAAGPETLQPTAEERAAFLAPPGLDTEGLALARLLHKVELSWAPFAPLRGGRAPKTADAGVILRLPSLPGQIAASVLLWEQFAGAHVHRGASRFYIVPNSGAWLDLVVGKLEGGHFRGLRLKNVPGGIIPDTDVPHPITPQMQARAAGMISRWRAGEALRSTELSTSITSLGEPATAAVPPPPTESNSASTAALQDQTITFDPPGEKTFGDAPFELEARASSGLPLSFTVENGPAALQGSQVTLTGAGTVTIKANQRGDGQFKPAEAVLSIPVAKAPQTISFDPIEEKIFGAPPFALNARSSSGLPVRLEASSSLVKLTGDQVTLLGAGVVTIKGSQSGDQNFQAAEAEQSFTVAPAGQTITFPPLPKEIRFAEMLPLRGEASSGLPVLFDVVSGPGLVAGNVLNSQGVGALTVKAWQAGNANYRSAPEILQTLTVIRARQTIAFDQWPDQISVGESFDAKSTASSKLPVVLELVGGSPAELQEGRLTGTAGGSVTIKAFQAGDERFRAGGSGALRHGPQAPSTHQFPGVGGSAPG